jgi:hypothetical protein
VDDGGGWYRRGDGVGMGDGDSPAFSSTWQLPALLLHAATPRPSPLWKAHGALSLSSTEGRWWCGRGRRRRHALPLLHGRTVVTWVMAMVTASGNGSVGVDIGDGVGVSNIDGGSLPCVLRLRAPAFIFLRIKNGEGQGWCTLIYPGAFSPGWYYQPRLNTL